MNFNFELILFYATVISGVIALIDLIFFARKRKAKKTKMHIIVDYARSFFPILLVVFLVRSFIYEPFRIPSGSLKPTLEVGDFILVNKFDYGVRLPITHKKIVENSEPQRGDIIVFRWPPDPSVDFIKRVIGLPGDHISYINKVLYVNGKEMPQTYVKDAVDHDETGTTWNVVQKQEDLSGIKHNIYQIPDRSSEDFKDVVVPKDMYFVMGDNRDDSADSRFFGFMPEQNIIGKASIVWMSWNSDKYQPRWSRIGKQIH